MAPLKLLLRYTEKLRRFVLLLILLLVFAGSAGAADNKTIRLGLVAYVGEATHFHALEKGYFRKQGLKVEATINDSGYQALNRLLNGEYDICTVETTPIVFHALRHARSARSFHIISSIFESSRLNSLVAIDRRRTPSIKALQGKRVGLAIGTSTEFFWYMAAISNGIDPGSVKVVDIAVPQMAGVLTGVDAVVAWPPYDKQIVESAGKHAKILPTGNIYTTHWLVVATPEFLTKQPNAAARYLLALKKAERDLESNPKLVARSQQKQIGSDPAALLKEYNKLDFDLNLSESVLISLHQQAEWIRLTRDRSVSIPSFRTYLNTEPLGKINPDAVRLIE